MVGVVDWIRDCREAPGPLFRGSWDALRRLPGGRRLFSGIVGAVAPFSGTIRPRVQALRHGYGRVLMPYGRPVLNHIGCVHAAALFNLMEFTALTTLAYTVPDSARFIVAHAELDYVRKGGDDVIGICECPVIESSQRREYDIPVRMETRAGELIARGTIRALVGPRRQ